MTARLSSSLTRSSGGRGASEIRSGLVQTPHSHDKRVQGADAGTKGRLPHDAPRYDKRCLIFFLKSFFLQILLSMVMASCVERPLITEIGRSEQDSSLLSQKALTLSRRAGADPKRTFIPCHRTLGVSTALICFQFRLIDFGFVQTGASVEKCARTIGRPSGLVNPWSRTTMSPILGTRPSGESNL